MQFLLLSFFGSNLLRERGREREKREVRGMVDKREGRYGENNRIKYFIVMPREIDLLPGSSI